VIHIERGEIDFLQNLFHFPVSVNSSSLAIDSFPTGFFSMDYIAWEIRAVLVVDQTRLGTMTYALSTERWPWA